MREPELEKLPDGKWLVRYTDNTVELFYTTVDSRNRRRIIGGGPKRCVEECVNGDFLKKAMANRPPIDSTLPQLAKDMHSLGYFVVPRVID